MSLTYEGLQAFYQGYIQSINSGEYKTTLSEFVHEELEYNERPLSREQYRANIDHLEDINFHTDFATFDVEQQCIAARLAIRGKLVKPLLTMTSPGESVLIRQHIFYVLRNSKVARVYTLFVPE